MEKYFIGIDPGSKGAVAILDSKGDVVLLEDIPFLKTEKCMDILAFSDLINDYILEEHHCVLEKCQYTPAIKGSGAFTFGKTIGYTECALLLLKVSHELVRPQLWKKEFSLLNKEKQGSIEVAKRLFPSMTDKLLKTKDGRAEALLIAEYCRRRNASACVR